MSRPPLKVPPTPKTGGQAVEARCLEDLHPDGDGRGLVSVAADRLRDRSRGHQEALAHTGVVSGEVHVRDGDVRHVLTEDAELVVAGQHLGPTVGLVHPGPGDQGVAPWRWASVADVAEADGIGMMVEPAGVLESPRKSRTPAGRTMRKPTDDDDPACLK